MNRGLLIVISGPSGVGKGTVIGMLMKNDKNVGYSVSSTTRLPREGEIDGVHYDFITAKQFKSDIENDRMLEYTVYCDNYYGTNADKVERLRAEGKDVILEIETQGAANIKRKCPDAVTVFIAPPTFDDLKKRLSGRGTEPPQVIEKRVRKAREELEKSDMYEYVVINDDAVRAADDLCAIIRAERIKKNNKFIF